MKLILWLQLLTMNSLQGPGFESHVDLDRRDWVVYLLVLATCRLPVSS